MIAMAGDLAARVRAQLEKWDLGDTALAATAVDLAERLDADGVRPAAAAMLHAQLRPVLLELAELAPEESADDKIDELTERRKRRRRERRGA